MSNEIKRWFFTCRSRNAYIIKTATSQLHKIHDTIVNTPITFLGRNVSTQLGTTVSDNDTLIIKSSIGVITVAVTNNPHDNKYYPHRTITYKPIHSKERIDDDHSSLLSISTRTGVLGSSLIEYYDMTKESAISSVFKWLNKLLQYDLDALKEKYSIDGYRLQVDYKFERPSINHHVMSVNAKFVTCINKEFDPEFLYAPQAKPELSDPEFIKVNRLFDRVDRQSNEIRWYFGFDTSERLSIDDIHAAVKSAKEKLQHEIDICLTKQREYVDNVVGSIVYIDSRRIYTNKATKPVANSTFLTFMCPYSGDIITRNIKNASRIQVIDPDVENMQFLLPN